jgi:hypothetical protein
MVLAQLKVSDGQHLGLKESSKTLKHKINSTYTLGRLFNLERKANILSTTMTLQLNRAKLLATTIGGDNDDVYLLNVTWLLQEMNE